MKTEKKQKTFLQHSIEIVVLILIALTFRSVLYEPYVVPSSSMMPTLIVGDRILVNKYTYGISRYSFPFSPKIFKGRILSFNKPKQGDIVVLETDKVYLKRVIGTPGDKVQMIDGSLYINDQEIQKTLDGSFQYNEKVSVPKYLEILPNGVKHDTLDLVKGSTYDTTDIFEVPKGYYFVMGDNRDDSRDSRDQNGPLGFIPEENFLGKVTNVLFSSKEISWWNIPNILLNLRSDRFNYSLIK